jgi:hypothetical protein
MRIWRRGFLASTLAAIALVLPSPTLAVTGDLVVGAGGTFTAPSGATGSVGGAFTLRSFGAEGSTLVATGDLLYSLCIPDVDPKNCLATIGQTVAIPVTAITASCSGVHLVIGPLTVVSPPSLEGYVLDFDAATLDLSPSTGAGSGLACALGHRASASGPSPALAPMLARFVAIG